MGLCFFSFNIIVYFRQMTDLRGCIDQWVAYQAGCESRDFKQLPGCPSITLISAVLEPCPSYLDGKQTAPWGGWHGKHWGSHLFQFTLCLQASLMGSRFMLIPYSMHQKSHLILHCKINLILAWGSSIKKRRLSGASYLCEKALCRISVSIHWVIVKISVPGKDVNQD